MARCRFVAPDIVRINLVDVHRRAHQKLQHELADAKKEKDSKRIKSLTDDLKREAARIIQAEQDGDWIDVKRELNAGEHDEMNASLVKDVAAGEKPLLDYKRVLSFKILAYLVDWSFTDKGGNPVPVEAATVASLTKRDRDEIGQAIEQHEADSDKSIDERKNADAPELPATLTSVEQ